MSTSTKTSVITNFFWRFFERCGAKSVSLIVSIILARLLEPTVYGTIALVTVFTTILQVFIDSGFGNALIQKKNADSLDFSSVFYFNIASGLFLYAIICLAAPYIADFYKISELTSIIRVLGITLLIASIKNIQQAYVSKHLMFKKFFFATLIGTIFAAIIGIWMAYLGYGVWALVIQHLVNSALDTVVLWFTVKWRPTLHFSLERLKSLFSFGWKLLVSSLIDAINKELRSLIIGKFYTREDLAFYNRGEIFPKVIVSNINLSIDSVLFPTMSKIQDDLEQLKAITSRAINIGVYCIAPCMAILAACAETLISLILTDKWLNSAFYLRIFCFSFCFQPIHTANLNAIKALGRSDLFLKLEIIKKIVNIIALFSTIFISVKAVALSVLVTNIISQIINSWPNKKLLKYSYLNQLKDILPSLLLATCMGIIVYSMNNILINPVALLAIQILLGLTIYITGSIILKFESYFYICNTIKAIYLKRKNNKKV